MSVWSPCMHMQLSNSFGSDALAFLFVIVNISHNGGDCSLCAWKSDISEGLGGGLWANCCTRRRKEELYGVWKCLIEVLSFFLASSCLGCTLQALSVCRLSDDLGEATLRITIPIHTLQRPDSQHRLQLLPFGEPRRRFVQQKSEVAS